MGLWDNEGAEPWDKDLPSDLIAAIKPMRKLFDRTHFLMALNTSKLCYACIHDELGDAYKENVKAFQALKSYVSADTFNRFKEQMMDKTLPSIFKAYFDFYVDGLANQICLLTRSLLAIGSANCERLGVNGVEWAESQAKDMIRSKRHLIVIWVRDACDKHVYDPQENIEEQIEWRKWRAPWFLAMKPARFGPYDAARVWERHDEKTSQQLLKAFADNYVIRLQLEIEPFVAQAYLDEALRPKPTMPVHSSKPDAQGTRSAQRLTVDSISPTTRKQMQAIFAALEARLEGPEYCRAVDQYRPPIPPSWTQDGWPGAYIKAYNKDKKWKKKIQDQKTKMRRKFDAMTPKARAEIIESRSRPTRQTSDGE